MRLRFIAIVVFFAGCGDASPPPPPPGALDLPEPKVLEAPCDQSFVTQGHWYWYAEAPAPEWEARVFTCVRPDAPFTPPVCELSTNYVIAGSTIRVLCGEWVESGGAYLADFARIEETLPS